MLLLRCNLLFNLILPLFYHFYNAIMLCGAIGIAALETEEISTRGLASGVPPLAFGLQVGRLEHEDTPTVVNAQLVGKIGRAHV